LSGQ
jgi:hypothetical protein